MKPVWDLARWSVLLLAILFLSQDMCLWTGPGFLHYPSMDAAEMNSQKAKGRLRSHPARSILVQAELAVAVALTPAALGQGGIQSLPFRTSAQQEVAPVEEIVDGQWIVIGTSEKNGGRVVRDGDNQHKGQPVYRFSAADDTVNRIEFSEIYGSAENLKGLSENEVADFLATFTRRISSGPTTHRLAMNDMCLIFGP